MGKEDILKFTNSIILISKLFTKTEDRFLKEKLYGKMSDFVGVYVAQSGHRDLLNSINNLLDYLEYLAHISKSNTTPLFLAQRNLLKFKLHVLKRNKTKSSVERTSGVSLTSNVAPIFDVANLATSKPSRKLARFALRADSNKERIFNFIKKTPDIRTKDVLNEFNVLSGRTVKRSLKELTEEGLLKKRFDGVAVYYFQASE